MSKLISYQEERSLSEVKKDLRNLKITTKDQAINILNFLSAIRAADKSLKEKAYKKLDDCVECDYYEATNGNQVQKIQVVKKEPKSDEYLESLLARKKEIDQEIKDYKEELKERGEYETIHSHYYKSV